MPKLSGKDLSSLYPKPRSYDELEAERKKRELQRRPRFVALKISLWTAFGILLVPVTYWVVSHLVVSSLSSPGQAISAASFSIFLILLAGAILIYLYSLINNLAARTLLSASGLHAVLISIVIIACSILMLLIQYRYANIVTILATLLASFLAAYLAANYVTKRQQ